MAQHRVLEFQQGEGGVHAEGSPVGVGAQGVRGVHIVDQRLSCSQLRRGPGPASLLVSQFLLV